MIRLLTALLIITGIASVAAWVAEYPGSVTIYWFDWRIDTSFAVLLTATLIAVIVLSYVYVLLRAIILAPVHFSEKRQLKHYRKGLTELTYSVASLAAADVKGAQAHTKKAEKLLGQTPLTLLLSAQIARSQGDDAKTRLLLTQMLDHKETEYLAARSLSEVANKQHQYAKALPLAERASAVNPRETSSVVNVVGLNIRLGQWQEAIQAIDRAARKGALLRSNKRYLRGMVYLKQGMQLLENSQPDSALASAYASYKLMPDFAPAIVLVARCLVATGKSDKAIKLIFKHWRNTPHPELAAVLRIAMAKEPQDKQMKRVRKLASLKPDDSESNLAVAETAIKFKEWETARKALKAVLAKDESMRACKLMAYTEQGEFSDFDAAGRWLARSADASPDPVWMCSHCSHRMDHFDTHCPSCGSFDALEWKHPTIKFVG